jgi:hypothetical protein
MQKVLIDRDQFISQNTVKEFDDFTITFHLKLSIAIKDSAVPGDHSTKGIIPLQE